MRTIFGVVLGVSVIILALMNSTVPLYGFSKAEIDSVIQYAWLFLSVLGTLFFLMEVIHEIHFRLNGAVVAGKIVQARHSRLGRTYYDVAYTYNNKQYQACFMITFLFFSHNVGESVQLVVQPKESETTNAYLHGKYSRLIVIAITCVGLLYATLMQIIEIF